MVKLKAFKNAFDTVLRKQCFFSALITLLWIGSTFRLSKDISRVQEDIQFDFLSGGFQALTYAMGVRTIVERYIKPYPLTIDKIVENNQQNASKTNKEEIKKLKQDFEKFKKKAEEGRI